MKQTSYYYLIFLTLLGGCSEKKSVGNDTEIGTIKDRIIITQQQFNENGMVLGHLVEKSFPTIVKANGLIDVPPENRATVSAVMGGYVKKIPLLVGDRVEKGSLLATLENPEYLDLQREYLEIKEQLKYLKSEYDRQKILFDERISSQRNYLKTEAEFKTANARHTALQKQLSMLNISITQVEKGNLSASVPLLAPIPGNITDVFVTKGAYITPSSPVLEIVNDDHIHLELSVFEKDIMKLKKGQSITFKVPEASDASFEAEVYLVGTTISEHRTIKVHAHLKEEEGHQFITGMFVDADIVVDSLNAWAIPSQAVVNINDGFYLLRLVEKNENTFQFEEIEIQKGASFKDFSQVIAGKELNSEHQFLVKGAFGIVGVE